MMRIRYIALTVIACLILAMPAHAQSEADAAASIQGELVRSASVIRGVERKLQDLDAHLEGLAQKQETIRQDLDTRREKMARMASALTRMGRTPREAVLIRPGGPLMAARTSMLLSAGFPVVQEEAKSYATLYNELEKTRGELAQKSAQAKAARDDLINQHNALTRLIEARNAANAPNIAQWQEDARRVAALSRAARSLRDFLSGLDTGDAARAKQDAYFASLPDDEGLMPVSGIVTVAYGQKDNIGATSSGITIEALSGAVVVAPLGGIVRYIGEFRGYGNIVIIAHKGGFYSLLAGVDKISVNEGQTIVSGEPIAILDSESDANPSVTPRRKKLYYELRQGGHPVNPAQKLPGLG